MGVSWAFVAGVSAAFAVFSWVLLVGSMSKLNEATRMVERAVDRGARAEAERDALLDYLNHQGANVSLGWDGDVLDCNITAPATFPKTSKAKGVTH